MRAIIDKAGRLVMPRALRDRVGLEKGGEVELEVDGSGIRIEPVIDGELVEQAGLLLIPTSGEPVDDALVRELIETNRDRHQ